LETATTWGFIQNPGSQDQLLTSLVDALLSTHKPSAAKATAADPLGGGNWEAEESEEAAEPVWAKSTPAAGPLFGSATTEPTNKRKAAPSKPGDGRSPAPGATSIKGNPGSPSTKR